MVISAYNFETTGSFTLTYATDVTGAVESGIPVTGAIKYGGQNTAYTFTAVANKAVTLAIANPSVLPVGNSLQMQAIDASGASDGATAYISTSPSGLAFTPTSAEAGSTTVVISAYNFETTGSFTLTCTGCATPLLPSAASVSPKSGPAGGGALVIITGTGFSGATAVSFGTLPGRQATVINDTTLAVLSPAEPVGAYNITVTTSKGTSPVVTADEFTVNPVPTVSKIAPTSGPTVGGTKVTITGTGFVAGATVLFGAVAGTGVTVVSSTEITAASPAQAAGVHNLEVKTTGWTSAYTSADEFTYQ